MNLFSPKIPKEVYQEALDIMREIIKEKMNTEEVEVWLRARLATKYDFEIAKKVASQMIYGY